MSGSLEGTARGMHGILSGKDTGTPLFTVIPGMIPAGWEFTNALCIFLYKPSLLA